MEIDCKIEFWSHSKIRFYDLETPIHDPNEQPPLISFTPQYGGIKETSQRNFKMWKQLNGITA